MNFKAFGFTTLVAAIALSLSSTSYAQGPGIIDGGGVFDGGGIFDARPGSGIIDGGGVFDGGGIIDRFDQGTYANGMNANTYWRGAPMGTYTSSNYVNSTTPIQTYTTGNVVYSAPVYGTANYSTTGSYVNSYRTNTCCCSAAPARRGLFGWLRR